MKRLSVITVVFFFLACNGSQTQPAEEVDVQPAEGFDAQPTMKVDALFVHREGSRGIADAVVWQEMLRNYQVETRLVSKAELDQEHFSGMHVVIIGAHTPERPEDKEIPWYNYWGDPQLVDALTASELPVIGIASGGLCIFGQMDLPVGGGYYAHGSEQLFTFAEHASEYLESPFRIESVEQVELSTRKQGMDGYHLPPSYIESILQNVTDSSYYSVVRYKNYVVWGAGPDAGYLTEPGRRLFANITHKLVDWKKPSTQGG